MANNRMFLTYRPTGESVCIGKRNGIGWGSPYDITTKMDLLFKRAEAFVIDGSFKFSQDDFILIMEDCEYSPGSEGRFTYGDDNVDGDNMIWHLELHDDIKG